MSNNKHKSFKQGSSKSLSLMMTLFTDNKKIKAAQHSIDYWFTLEY